MALHSVSEYRRTRNERDTRTLNASHPPPYPECVPPYVGSAGRPTPRRERARIALREQDPGCPPPRPPGCPSGRPPPRPPRRTPCPQANPQATDTAGQVHDLRPIGLNALSRANPARMRSAHQPSARHPPAQPRSLTASLLLTCSYPPGGPAWPPRDQAKQPASLCHRTSRRWRPHRPERGTPPRDPMLSRVDIHRGNSCPAYSNQREQPRARAVLKEARIFARILALRKRGRTA
jgi:hypothetical protein